ncbi:hypothetical protein NSERUTF1_1575 [Nocardia seriolae]|nr:hypothetical protein NSERUTF1_1575 [Nocardia seriolae]
MDMNWSADSQVGLSNPAEIRISVPERYTRQLLAQRTLGIGEQESA